MASELCKVTVGAGGRVVLPKHVRDKLRLRQGDQVSIRLEPAEACDNPGGDNPLYGIIGIAASGRHDGAENHDAYLNSDGAS